MLSPFRPYILLFTSFCAASTKGIRQKHFSTQNSVAKMTSPSNADPLVGKKLPDYVLDEKLQTEKNSEVTLRSILAGLPKEFKGIVVFLFPAVNTPHCTKQACLFSSSSTQFKNLGYEVFGLTKLSGSSAEDWAKKNSLSYPILMDPNWVVIKYLNCTWMYFLVNRSHLILGRDGKILAIERGVKSSESSRRVIQLIKSLQ